MKERGLSRGRCRRPRLAARRSPGGEPARRSRRLSDVAFWGVVPMAETAAADIAALAARLSAAAVADRLAAAEALARAGEEAAAAAVPLVKACGDADDSVREQVVAALEDAGPPPDTAVAPLGELLGAAEPLVAYWAATLLGRAGAAAAAAVPALAARLAPPTDLAVRQRAAWALGQIGAAAKPAVAALEAAQGDADPRLARLAAEALAAING